MRTQCARVLAGAYLACLLIPVSILVPADLRAAAADRVTAAVDSGRLVRLEGGVHPLARAEAERGAVEAERQISGMSLDLAPTPEQQAALEALLEAQRDPGSADYQRWLTPAGFGERFGVSANDFARVASWLEAEGFTIEHRAEARNWILFGGTAAQVARTFHTSLRRYEVDGEMHYANSVAPSVPEAFGGVVTAIRGLDDFRPKPTRTVAKVVPDFNAAGGVHYLAPDDLAAIYDIAPLYKAGYDGLGQRLAVAGQTDINVADLRQFRTQFGMPVRDPQVVVTGADPGTSKNDLIEATLDLEWAGAVARSATLVYVNSGNVFTSAQYAISQNLAPVLSFSYGACETVAPAGFRAVAQQAAAQGITWITASGDQGAAACDYGAAVATHGPAVSFPADIPEIVAVGGAEFNEPATAWAAQNGTTFASALGYMAEKGWNDSAASGELSASGGGASVLFAKPWWQTGAGVPADNARDVPDVALAASALHDGFMIYSGGQLMAVGGTSASAPAFAGMVALLNQYLVAKGSIPAAGLGNLNPGLYALAASSGGIFHDITTGNNIVPCRTGSAGCANGAFGYTAGPGYDLVTGLGSVDAYNLVTKWTAVPAATGTTTTLAASAAQIAAAGSVLLTATVAAVSGTAAPTGSVTFTAGSVVLGSAALGSAALGGAGGGAAVATLTVKGSALASGANTVTAAYLATGVFRDSNGTATVTVIPAAPVATATTVSASPASVAASGSTTLTVTVKAASGSVAPGGAVALSAGKTVLGTVTLAAAGASGTGVLTVKASALAAGANTIAAAYTASTGFANSAGTVVVTVTGATSPTAPSPTSPSPTAPGTTAPGTTATSTTLTASPASIAAKASTVLNAVVKPLGGSAQPTGAVQFLLAGKPAGTANIVVANSTATASLTLAGSLLATGSNSVTASYLGAGGFGASTSPAIAVTVAPPLIATTLVVVPLTSAAQQNGARQFTATVIPVSGTAVPGGTVTLMRGNVTLASGTLSAGGSATFSIAAGGLPTGTSVITASYSGSATFAPAVATFTVSAAQSTTR